MAFKCPECGTTAHARTPPMKHHRLNAHGICARTWNVPAHLPHLKVWIR